MVKNSGPSHCWVALPITGGSAKAMILKAGWMGKIDLKEKQNLKHNLSHEKLGRGSCSPGNDEPVVLPT